MKTRGTHLKEFLERKFTRVDTHIPYFGLCERSKHGIIRMGTIIGNTKIEKSKLVLRTKATDMRLPALLRTTIFTKLILTLGDRVTIAKRALGRRRRVGCRRRRHEQY